ncbi:MAG: hypothetical protein LW860_00745 [Xanthomonadaceae bacterium]|jgi:hypothetical protein|nr:hypothetical protein [Xanthomonadaceae bacterium]
MTPEDFRDLLKRESDDYIVNSVILSSSPGAVIDSEALLYLEESAREWLGVATSDSLSAVVVGSAKLGFSIVGKPARGKHPYKPPYRAYVPGVSDIDVAIVSPVVYGRIWQEIAAHAAIQPHFPMSGMLPRYMAREPLNKSLELWSD